LNTFIRLPWQRLVPERCDCNYQNPWTVKEYCSLFINTGHNLWRITIMPLIKVYNIDSDPYGLKGHSIFKSVCNTEASWKGTFGQPIQTASAESRFFLQDLRRRSIVPTITWISFLHLLFSIFRRLAVQIWIIWRNSIKQTKSKRYINHFDN
jgi:hypothetical protein